MAEKNIPTDQLQLTLIISTSVISNNRLSRRKNLLLVMSKYILKILWERGEIAPEEQFLLLSTIFCNLMLEFYVYLHIHLLNLVVRFVFSSILKICYVEVRISRSVSEGPFKFEITRVSCILPPAADAEH